MTTTEILTALFSGCAGGVITSFITAMLMNTNNKKAIKREHLTNLANAISLIPDSEQAAVHARVEFLQKRRLIKNNSLTEEIKTLLWETRKDARKTKTIEIVNKLQKYIDKTL